MTHYVREYFRIACLACALCAHTVTFAEPVVASSPPLTVPPSPVETPEEDEYAPPAISDPLEGLNRAVFRFNDGFYDYIGSPVARGYETAVPQVARTGLGNFFDNALYPVRLVGSLLQGKVGRAGLETGKFLVNSTAGFAGFYDAAKHVPPLADVPPEDVGQALGSWGVPHGPYLVLPIIGPTTTRDLVGRFGDRFATPWNWDWLAFYEWEWSTAAAATQSINSLPRQIGAYNAATRAAADPYLSVRGGYVQFRDAQVAR